MKDIEKHILKDIGEKLAKKEELTFQERQAKLDELSEKELKILLEISEICEEAGNEDNLSEAQLKRLEKLSEELEEEING